MADKVKFAVDEHVRFIGTDTVYVVQRYDKNIAQYQVQRGDDKASLVRVAEIYLERADDKAGK